MLSALYRLTQYILGADNTDQDGDVKEASKGESGQCHGLGGTSQSGDGAEYVSFSGKVTSVFSHYAMINDTIYCAFEVIFGGRHPHIGDQVKGQARRPHDDAGWRATQLTVLDEPCWDEPTPTSDSSAPPDGQRVDDDTWRHLSSTDSGAHAADDDDGEPRELIGQVTSADPLGGAIEGGVAYAASVCAGFGAGPPVVGDWVRATATRGGATCVAPLRRRAYQGKVTFVQGSSARVDDEVAAEATTTCEVGGRLRVGDEVGGLAVESSQGRLTWRAISMNRISSSNHDRPGIVVTTTPLKKSFLGELLRNKEGVTVTSPLEFGTVELGRTVYLTAWIQNEGSTEQMLLRCRVTTTLTQLTIDSPKIISTDPKQVEVLAQEDGIALLPGGICYVNIICHATDVGTATQTLLFEFDGFKIGRRVGVTVRDPSESLLAPQPRADRGRRERARDAQQRFDEKHGGWVVPGQRPLPAKARPFLARLGRWPVPGDLRQGALRGEDPATQRSCLRAPLALRNFGDRFHALLHVEEIVSEMEMRENDLRDATMTRHHDNDTLALAVPGLAEGRPSLMLGDKALVTEGAAGAAAPAYEGYVHAVRQEEVLLAFHPSFQREYAGGAVDVAFVCSRAQTQRHHEAVARAPLVGAAVLFPQRLTVSMPLYVPPPPPPPVRCRRAAPRVRRAEAGLSPGMDDGRTKVMGSPPGIMADGRTKVMGSPPGIMADGRTKVMGPGTADGQAEVTWSPPGPVAPAVPDATTAPHSFEFFNAALNSRQRSAVVRMLGAQSRPTPYVLFGPPGTGKTITIVEAMLQVLSRLPSTRILVCTPSNSAADLIVQRLHESGRVTTADMVRYMAFQRSDETVPDDVRDYCVRCDDDALTCAVRRRLVVSTCGSCGTLAALGLPPDHFTHVFVDEAGQATEPETLIPIAMAAPAGGQVVLSGDPMQLGPVLRSPFAKTYGLETSLLERLCQRPLYCRDESRFANHGSYDPLLVTKL
ncbi:PREDICTED: putative helicase Mov10l1 isoform X2 [Priapulus caudatus]|uniref:Helicase Mov10l1 isoform X2 n=1 Tax=Priapulus caudatus TaxID=37621 RepID=A0ABM1EWD3_PRICU|nr:PREDICTED: putative helicase Mov10l1 isoform X2 [Priapulus caudatus]